MASKNSESSETEKEILAATDGEQQHDNIESVTSESLRNGIIELERKLAALKTGVRTRSKLERLRDEVAELENSRYTKTRTKDQISELQTEKTFIEARKMEIARVFQLMTASRSVQLCFMVDCTGSMASYIQEVKEKIQMIVDRSKGEFPDLNLAVAFVGYRDHCDGAQRTVVLNFTASVLQFKSFVGSVQATGGGDAPEDVFGGFEEVTKLTWNEPTRILFHIADSPCHGTRFHAPNLNDDYPNGDPRGLNIEDLLSRIKQLKVIYWFAKLSDTTDKMTEEFQSVMAPEQINVIPLSSVDDLMEAVLASISASIQMEEHTILAKECEEEMKRGADRQLKSYKLEKTEPDWASLEKQKVIVWNSKFLPDSKWKQMELKNAERFIKIASNPFAEGVQRIAHYAIDCTEGSMTDIVLKQFKYAGEYLNRFDRYKEQMEIQSVAVELAQKFNTIKPDGARDVHFAQVSIATFTEGERQIHFTKERRIKGKYLKFMNNAGFVNKGNYTATLNAFSYWTYCVTRKYLMVVDLQGVKEEAPDGVKYTLTDPAIHCGTLRRFGSTNLGREGMYKFFQTHHCNSICKALSLPIHRMQPEDGYTDLPGATIVGNKS